jgi:hypothetical protein
MKRPGGFRWNFQQQGVEIKFARFRARLSPLVLQCAVQNKQTKRLFGKQW